MAETNKALSAVGEFEGVITADEITGMLDGAWNYLSGALSVMQGRRVRLVVSVQEIPQEGQANG